MPSHITRTDAASDTVLTDEMLARFAERAARYDRENAFFSEDFEELRDAGYLRLALPRELGGSGRSLAEVVREQRRLGIACAGDGARDQHASVLDRRRRRPLRAPATLAAVAARGDRARRGVRRRPRRERQRHPRAALDHQGRARRRRLPVHRPQVVRQPDAGLDLPRPPRHGRVRSVASEDRPRVHAARHRGLPRSRRPGTSLGMRATRSDDTILDGAFVPDRYVARVVPAGAAGIDHFVLGLFAWALLGFGNIYYGLARRALRHDDRSRSRPKRSIAVSRTMAYHAELQHRVAEMTLALDPIEPHLERVADRLVGRGRTTARRGRRRSSAPSTTRSKASWRVVDLALEAAGGFGIFRRSGLEQLFRDARLGRIHPANSMLTHEIVAKTVLGISPDETPRWG